MQVKAKLSKKEQIPQLDGAVDDCVVSRRSLRVRKSAKENPPSKTGLSHGENEASSRRKISAAEKKQKKKYKRSNAETVSKYNFSGDDSKSLSDENMPPAKKIGALASQAEKKRKSSKKKADKLTSKHFAPVRLDEVSTGTDKILCYHYSIRS